MIKLIKRCYLARNFTIANLFPREAKFVFAHFSPSFHHPSDARGSLPFINTRLPISIEAEYSP